MYLYSYWYQVARKIISGTTYYVVHSSNNYHYVRTSTVLLLPTTTTTYWYMRYWYWYWYWYLVLHCAIIIECTVRTSTVPDQYLCIQRASRSKIKSHKLIFDARDKICFSLKNYLGSRGQNCGEKRTQKIANKNR